MRPRDTSPEAYAKHLEFYRRLGTARRLQLGLRMSDEARQIMADGIRHRHPEYDDEEVKWALFRLTLGDELFTAAWPHAPLLDP